MKKHLPNFITCLNLLTGSIGIYFTFSGEIDLALYFVIICGVFDFLDGLVARALNVHSAIGKELDSLADVISFGFLPSALMFQLIQSETTNYYLPFSAFLMVAFSALRLAKFNVDENQSDKFIGVPTPANAIMITSIPFLTEGMEPGPIGLLVITGLSCFLLVAPIPMIALKFKNYKVSANFFRYLLIIFSILLVIIFRLKGVAFIIPLYVLISIAWNLTGKNSVKSV